MKSIFVFACIILALTGVLAAASQGTDSVQASGSGDEERTMYATGAGEGEQVRDMERIKVQDGTHNMADGKQLMIKTEANNQIRLEVGGQMARSSVAIEQETVNGQTKLSAKLSNGNNAEVKVMPDQASETALERLRLKSCTEEAGCSIELKEVGEGNEAKLAYEVRTQRKSRFLGIFSADMNVDAQVDAETGKVLDTNKPWWAFLASEPEE